VRRRDHDGKPEDIITHISFVVSYYVEEELLLRLADDIAHELDEERAEPAQHPLIGEEPLNGEPASPWSAASDPEMAPLVEAEHDAGDARKVEAPSDEELSQQLGNGDTSSVMDPSAPAGAAMRGNYVHDQERDGGASGNSDEGIDYVFAADGHGNRPKRRRRTYPPATVERLWKGQLVERRRRRRRNRAGRYILEFEVEPHGIGNTTTERWLNARRRWVGVDQFERLWRTGRVVGDSGAGEGV